MSNIHGFVQQESASRASDGTSVGVRATRDGSLYTSDWYTNLALEGRAYGANSGTATGQVTYEEGYAAAEQDLFLHVPSSVVVIPTKIHMVIEDTGGINLTADFFAAVSSVGDSAVTGTALTIRNARTSVAGSGSACTATGVVTSNGSDITGGNYFEFWRPIGIFADSFNANTAPVSLIPDYNVSQEATPVIVDGGGSVSVFFGATVAVIGFSTLNWVELPSGAV